jgi:hypothetical protein
MRRMLMCALALTLAICIAAPAMAAEAVAQGKTVSYDKEKKVIVIEEYNTNFTKSKMGEPTGKELTFSTADATVGALPEPGNIVRIAYEDKGGTKAAHRIMNVTKTDLRKK